MDLKKAFDILVGVREKFTGTKQDQIVVDQAFQTIYGKLFQPAEKPAEKPVKKNK